jgi:hypothetical protein
MGRLRVPSRPKVNSAVSEAVELTRLPRCSTLNSASWFYNRAYARNAAYFLDVPLHVLLPESLICAQQRPRRTYKKFMKLPLCASDVDEQHRQFDEALEEAQQRKDDQARARYLRSIRPLPYARLPRSSAHR